MSTSESSLRICTFNCEGNNILKFEYVKELLSKCDVLFLQEFWLLNNALHKLDALSDDFDVFAMSGVPANCEIITGRPYGGCAVFCRKTLGMQLQRIACNSNRISVCKGVLPRGTSVLLCCVYLPCDSGNVTTVSDEFLYEISIVESLLYSEVFDHVLIGGDFNTDFGRVNAQTNCLKQLMLDVQLYNAWLSDKSVTNITYAFSDESIGSTIDHVLCSKSVFSDIKEMCIIDSPLTPSRHKPVMCVFTCLWSKVSNDKCSQTFCPRPAWYRASSVDIDNYKSVLAEKLQYVHIPDVLCECVDNNCKLEVHHNLIDCYTDGIIDSCLQAEKECIPQTRPPKQHATAGWTTEVQELKEASLYWHRIWRDAGRPRNGELANVMRYTKRKYHKAAKVCMRTQNQLRRLRLAEKSMCNKCRPLFAELKKISGKAPNKISKHIDGISSSEAIASTFASKYEMIYNSGDALNEHIRNEICTDVSESVQISEPDVFHAIEALKLDKTDGCGFYSNHVMHGGNILCEKLASLLKVIFSHSYTPKALLRAKIVSIPKDRLGDLSTSDNYRGIALCICLSKIIDLVILHKYSEELRTNSLQFAYKKSHSTVQCTTVLKEVVRYFWSGNSDVHACFVDATKAFDKVNFSKLFELLLQRNLPRSVLRLLLDSYERQVVTAFWDGSESDPFPVCNGVRQGAVLSATLFAVYMDELLRRLEESGIGCHIGNHYFGALAYADDLTLICPTFEGLRKMICTIEEFGTEYCMSFNPKKTQCMKFTQHRQNVSQFPILQLAGRDLVWVEDFKYLGTFITYNLDDTSDIEHKRQDFIRQANYVLHSFCAIPAYLKDELVQTYCTSFYGSQSWDLSNKHIRRLQTSWNIIQRRIWRLPNIAHCSIVKWLSVNSTVNSQLYSRCMNFNRSLLHSENPKLRFIGRISFDSAQSLISRNNNFCDSKLTVLRPKGRVLSANFDGLPSEDDWRVSRTIHELNFAMDGFFTTGLSHDETTQLLRFISCD